MFIIVDKLKLVADQQHSQHNQKLLQIRKLFDRAQYDAVNEDIVRRATIQAMRKLNEYNLSKEKLLEITNKLQAGGNVAELGAMWKVYLINKDTGNPAAWQHWIGDLCFVCCNGFHVDHIKHNEIQNYKKFAYLKFYGMKDCVEVCVHAFKFFLQTINEMVEAYEPDVVIVNISKKEKRQDKINYQYAYRKGLINALRKVFIEEEEEMLRETKEKQKQLEIAKRIEYMKRHAQLEKEHVAAILAELALQDEVAVFDLDTFDADTVSKQVSFHLGLTVYTTSLKDALLEKHGIKIYVPKIKRKRIDNMDAYRAGQKDGKIFSEFLCTFRKSTQ